MKKIILFLFCSLSIISSVQAQAQGQGQGEKRGMYGILAYSPALPVGKTSDFTSNFSFTGGTLEAGGFLSNNLALGVSGRFHYLYEKRENTVYTGDQNDLAVYGT